MSVTATWVYIRSEAELYTVGFYDPAGRWQPESNHETKEQASARVHWLNGGHQAGRAGKELPC